MKSLSVNSFHEELLQGFSLSRKAKGFNRGMGDDAPILCREYLNFLEGRGQDNVLNSPASDYRLFLQVLYKRSKAKGNGLLSKTHFNHIRYAVGSFYDHLYDAGLIETLPGPRKLFAAVRIEAKPVLSVREIECMFKHAVNSLENMLLALTYGCGLRRAELVRLNLFDYKPQQSLLIVRCGKSSKSRSIPVAARMKNIINEYLNNYRLNKCANGSNAMLVNNLGTPLNGGNLYKIIKRIAKRSFGANAKYKSVNLHIMRNSVAVHMLNRGAEMQFVKRFLGHTLLDTTMLYAKRRRTRVSIQRKLYVMQYLNYGIPT